MLRSETEILTRPSSSSNYGSISEDCDILTNREDEDDVRVSESSETPSGQRSLCRIEIVAFLVELANGLHAVIRTNLLIEKVCRVDLNLGNKICDDIGNHQKEQNMVQERVNDINLYNIFLASVPWYVETHLLFVCYPQLLQHYHFITHRTLL